MMTKGHRPLRKQLGQHLLMDGGVLQKIVSAARLKSNDRVLEIGAGSGRLTGLLAREASQVVAVELDRGFLPDLECLAAMHPGLTIVMDNVLDLDLSRVWSMPPESEIREPGGRWKVVANLPYYITTPVLTRLLENEYTHLHSLVLLLQEEVARRVAALPGTPDYGALSLLVRYRTIPELLFRVRPESFVPRPRVKSALVRLSVLESPPVEGDPVAIFALVRAGFGQRRKTLLNSVSALPWSWSRDELADRMRAVGISPQQRGETLSLEDFARLAAALGRPLGRSA